VLFTLNFSEPVTDFDLSKLSITTGEPAPAFDPVEASRQLVDDFIPAGQRARLFDLDGLLVADSYAVSEAIPGQPLPPALR
jgi:two-component system sensor histidine kinase ChvG